MKNILLSIQDSKFPLFIEFIKTLNYVDINEPDQEDAKECTLARFKDAVDELKLIQQGKINTISAKKFKNNSL
ncbi:MAG: hypothetical protein K2X94_00920 [Amoebophilaceae bacterium]|nr:hypothetical protein [Amoebophilaceae bacterium]